MAEIGKAVKFLNDSGHAFHVGENRCPLPLRESNQLSSLVQRCESSVRSLATRCIHPQRQQTPRSLETMMMFRLAHPKRHLLFSRRASRKSTNRTKEMIPTPDIQKTNSRISVSVVFSLVKREKSPRRRCFSPTARARSPHKQEMDQAELLPGVV